MRQLLTTMATVAALAGAARADVLAPDQGACANKKPGDACIVDGAEGVCVKGTRQWYSFPKKKLIDVDAPRCVAKKKSSQRERAPIALAFGFIACGAGVLLSRRRPRV